MFLFVGFNKGDQYLQPVPFRRLWRNIKELFSLFQRYAIIIFSFYRSNVHVLELRSDGNSIDVVIFSMGTQKSNIGYPEIVLNGSHQPVSIAFHVKNHSVVSQEAGMPVISLDIRGRSPLSMFHISVPGQQRLFRIRVRFPKVF